jgi:alginate O-acetyltransferase complex protein AlgI
MRLMGRFESRSAEPAIVVMALFVTFFLVGAWHGQTTTFLFFGVLQGFGVAANRLFQFSMVKRLGKQRYRALCANPLCQ